MLLINPNNHSEAMVSQNANADHSDPNNQNGTNIYQYFHTLLEYSLLIHINHQLEEYPLSHIP